MVITDVNQVVYQGDGATTAFPFTFRIIDATDVKLLLIDADGTETDITSDYFVDTNTNTVHYPGYAPGAEPGLADQPAPVQEGQRLVVYRELPVTQEKDLGEKWPFFVIELALDKLTMLIQQVKGIWDRCLKVSVGQEATAPDFNYTVPIEAGKTFRVKDDGTGFELTEDPAVAHAAAVAAQEAAELAQGIAEEARDDAEAAAANAEDALDLIKEKATWFDNVATMKAAAGLQVGMLAGTKGYYSINDGCYASYFIREKTEDDVEDDVNIIFLENGNVAEKLHGVDVNLSDRGAFKFGKLHQNLYCNGMDTDGTNFYVGYGYYGTVDQPKVVKYDNNGKELATYDVSGHGSAVCWNPVKNRLYVCVSGQSFYEFDADLNKTSEFTLSSISASANITSMSYDPMWNKVFVVTDAYGVYEFSAADLQYTNHYDLPFVASGRLTTQQDSTVVGGHLFLCACYPNTIIEYDLVSGEEVNCVTFGNEMDGTYLGEIEGICAYPTKEDFELFVSFAVGTGMGYYYSTLFALSSESDMLAPFPVTTRLNYIGLDVVQYYVDGTYTGEYSTGEQDHPWTSMVECFMHTANPLRYKIYVVNANSTYDAPSTVRYAPKGVYDIYMQGVPNGGSMRFRDSTIRMHYESSQTYIFSVENCRCEIITTGNASAETALTLNTRTSYVTVTGNVYRVYNYSSTVNVSGNITNVTVDGSASQYYDGLVHDDTRIPVITKSLTVKGNETVNVGTINNTHAMSLIVALSGTNGSKYNAMFAVIGYGVGGSTRTFAVQLTNNTLATATVSSSSNTVNFAVPSGSSSDKYTVNVTVLSGNSGKISVSKA